MGGSEISALESVVRRVSRTHLGAMTSGPWQDDEIVRRQLETMTIEERAAVTARINAAIAELREDDDASV